MRTIERHIWLICFAIQDFSFFCSMPLLMILSYRAMDRKMFFVWSVANMAKIKVWKTSHQSIFQITVSSDNGIFLQPKADLMLHSIRNKHYYKRLVWNPLYIRYYPSKLLLVFIIVNGHAFSYTSVSHEISTCMLNS